MKALTAILAGLAGIFAVLNTFGGIISGVWLAILGEWWAIGLGLLLMMVSTFILSIVLIPSLALAAGAYMTQRSRVGITIVALFSNLYVAAVITAWSIGMLYAFMSRASGQNWIPLLLWSYGAAMGPWAYMAAKEEQNDEGNTSFIAVMFAQVAYVVMVLLGIFGGLTMIGAVKVFGGVMAVYAFGAALLTYLMWGDIEAGQIPSDPEVAADDLARRWAIGIVVLGGPAALAGYYVAGLTYAVPLLFAATLGCVAYADFRAGTIPDEASLGGAVIGLAAAAVGPAILWHNAAAWAGTLLAGDVVNRVGRARGYPQLVGGGAVKAGALVGACLGPWGLVFAVFTGSIAISFAPSLVRKGAGASFYRSGALVPLGGALALGGLLYQAVGPMLIEWYITRVLGM